MKTAFFYNEPVILDRNLHKNLRFKPVGHADFARQAHVIPLVLAEFVHACLEYPIVFVKNPNNNDWMVFAVAGFEEGQNRFITAEGKWDARYLPASIRRYPFILAETGPEQFSVAADISAPHFVGKEGTAIFEANGEPSGFMKEMLALLSDFQGQAVAASAFVKRLADLELLNETTLNVQSDNGESASLAGAWVVDEAKLRDVSDTAALELFRSGDTALIHAHLLSLRNLVPLLNRPVSATKSAAKVKPASKPIQTASPAKKAVAKKAPAKPASRSSAPAAKAKKKAR